MTALIDGPRIPPADGGPARSLVVFVHGYGADGNDLIDLGRMFAPVLPGTAFASPHAPEPAGDLPFGRQWFPLAHGDMHAYFAGVRHAAPALDAFLDAELARLGLTDAALALVGFSQGSMMALHVGPRRHGRIAGIVAYSGLLAGGEHLAIEARNQPPVLLVHGEADPVIPVVALHAPSPVLSPAGFEVAAHVRPGLAHGIDEEGLRLGAAFLRRVLPA